MGTIDRMKLILKANLNDIISKSEDPAKAMGLMLEEMRQSIRSIKSLILEATAELKQAERAADENIHKSHEWEEKAAFALKKGREDLARQALSRKKTLFDKGNNYREQIAVQQANFEILKESLKTLEAKMSELRSNQAKLAAQQEYAKLRRPVPVRPAREPVMPVIDTTTIDTYDRMVSKVEEMEALAEALAEMTQEDKLEREFRELEAKDKLDKDLEELKAKISVTQNG
jgi:phage shock protein A